MTKVAYRLKMEEMEEYYYKVLILYEKIFEG